MHESHPKQLTVFNSTHKQNEKKKKIKEAASGDEMKKGNGRHGLLELWAFRRHYRLRCNRTGATENENKGFVEFFFLNAP